MSLVAQNHAFPRAVSFFFPVAYYSVNVRLMSIVDLVCHQTLDELLDRGCSGQRRHTFLTRKCDDLVDSNAWDITMTRRFEEFPCIQVIEVEVSELTQVYLGSSRVCKPLYHDEVP